MRRLLVPLGCVALVACGSEPEAGLDPVADGAVSSVSADVESESVAVSSPDEIDPSPTSTESSSEPVDQELAGAWILVSGPRDPIPGWDVTVEFDGDRITGTAACNGYGGSIETRDGTIVVGDLAQTMMGCEDAVQELERAFLTSLRSAGEYVVSDDELAITTPQGVWHFERLPPVPASDLIGTTWMLDGFIDGNAVSREAGMENAFVELSDDGTVRGATNCRQLSGTWIETASEIVFTTFSAEGDCPSDSAYDLDGRILSVLGDGFRAEIDGDQLVLTSQGDIGLVFRAASEPEAETLTGSRVYVDSMTFNAASLVVNHQDTPAPRSTMAILFDATGQLIGVFVTSNGDGASGRFFPDSDPAEISMPDGELTGTEDVFLLEGLTIPGNYELCSQLVGQDGAVCTDFTLGPYEAGSVGVTYDYSLYVHCGVEWARIDGAWWRTDPLSDGNGNPPDGWDNPDHDGNLTLTSSNTATFDGPDGPIEFTRTSTSEPPGCD